MGGDAAEMRAFLDLIENASRITAFTGAGISTECGVPDFRSPDSPWMRWPPIDFATFMASEDNRREAWRRKFLVDDMWVGAQPGRGHAAFARLARQGRLGAIVTQNIDGLHQASGVDPGCIVELHGNGQHASCLACGTRYELAPLRYEFFANSRLPSCVCGGIVKSATISFGQAMPRVAMRQALDASLDCDLFLVVGSSLVVQPAAQFPVLARDNGAKLAILNAESTPLDVAAHLVLHRDIGDVLAHVAVSHRLDKTIDGHSR